MIRKIIYLLTCIFTFGNLYALSPPFAVNLGGVYVLEDWFLSEANIKNVSEDKHVGIYVSTPCDYVVGDSKKFIVNDDKLAQFYFTSEVDLIKQLRTKYNKSDKDIINYFKAHRQQYLSSNTSGENILVENFKQIKSLGISVVRLPITWAITYEEPYDIYNEKNITFSIPAGKSDYFIIQDPFHYTEEMPYAWASIPISEIEHILEIAEQNGIRVLLDIHAYPGGASGGTFNGVWPLPPEFWTATTKVNGQAIYRKNFQTIVGNLINWAGALKNTNKAAYRGLFGITPMNEPAHLHAIPDATCNPQAPWISDVSYTDILETLNDAIVLFKNSNLPKDNKYLVLNVIETMIPNSTGKSELAYIGNWWQHQTSLSDDDRKQWAYLDIHHYFAWDEQCNQCLQQYIDKDIIKPEAFDNIHNCAKNFYGQLRDSLGVNQDVLLATSEFSASTNFDTKNSCSSNVSGIKLKNYQQYRDKTYESQVKYANENGIKMFFWTWKLPYNHNFQNEWSFSYIESQSTNE
ncbi:cellulase family glycosylhydrolase [Thiotrichales bacterium 19S3-7]|nr:cellulase family glycosylhydrolase [Thiotrichales bacterium 19S3-7]MCF6800947.1 cellulase family glycosylhydrolase [Thiotrichales bacterium 19S3-11]